MSEKGLPPYPLGGDWLTWARQLVEFLSNEARSEEFVAPRIISLLHQIPPVDQYRALEDGLLMFDPGLGVPVYSDAGQWKQFTAAGSLNYLVTFNAGNGSVVDDINNTDFTGQDGAVGQCAQAPVNTEVAFYHNGVQYLYNGPRPASYGAGCADTMQDSYLIPVGVGTFLALTDTPATYTGFSGQWPRVSGNQLIFDVIEEVDITNLDRVRWRGNWVQQQYAKNDMVLGDGNWLMIANKQTTDVAPPRPDPDTGTFDLPDVPTWAELTHTGVVESGRIWTVNKPIIVVGYEVWVPELNSDTNYVIKVYRQPTGQPDQREFIQIAEPLLVAGDWATVSTRRVTIPAGYDIAIVIDALNAGSNTSPGGTPADWVRAANDNNADPLTGQWNRNNNETLLRIHETDADSNLLDLNGVVAGSTFEIVDTNNPSRSVTYRAVTDEIYAGNVYSWTVENIALGVQGEPLVGARTIMTITVPVAAATKYVAQPLGNPTHNWGTSEGVLLLSGIPAGSITDAFGVRIYTEEYITSPDWDIASSMGSGGSGGGSGGASTFLELSDTPASYAGQSGNALVVTAGEDGLEFGTVSVGDFVQKSGDEMSGDLRMKYVNPAIFFEDTDGPANEKITRIMQDSNRLRFSRFDDVGSTDTLALLDETGWTIRNSDGGTWPIMQNNGNIKGVAALFESGLFLRSDSNTGVSFRDAADNELFKIIRDSGSNELDVYKSDAGTNDRRIATFDDVGPQVSSLQTVITQEKMLAQTQRPITSGDAFPAAPTVGDQHYLTVQPVGMYYYYDDGNSQQWVQQNGGYANGALTQIVDDNSDYTIVGNTLICWGIAAASNNNVAVVFPREFGAAPTIFGSVEQSSGALNSASTNPVEGTITTTGFTTRTRAGSDTINKPRHWMAIGPCRPEDAMPTEVGGSSGGSSSFMTKNNGDQRYTQIAALEALTQLLKVKGVLNDPEIASIMALTEVDDNG